MPIPADVMRRKLRKKIKDLSAEGKAEVLREALQELPGYTSGPYGRLKNWIKEQMTAAETQSGVVSREAFMVKKEGDRTVALVGPPNCGKSSLLSVLTGRKVRVGDYPFTTVRPVAGMLNYRGAAIQMIEIPGLLEGAGHGRGSGRAYLSAVRTADAGVYMGELSDYGLKQFSAVYRELCAASIEMPHLVVPNKTDLPGADSVLDEYRAEFSHARVVPVSTAAGEGIDELVDAVWGMANLVRIYPRVTRGRAEDPIILPSGSTIEEFAAAIHGDLKCRIGEARVWGPSEVFPGGPVSFTHMLQDEDEVHLNIRK